MTADHPVAGQRRRREISKVTALTNPVSGHGAAVHAAQIAIARLQRRGVEVVEIIGDDAEDARCLARAAVERGTDALMVTGGDGVISESVRDEQRKFIKYNHLVANLLADVVETNHVRTGPRKKLWRPLCHVSLPMSASQDRLPVSSPCVNLRRGVIRAQRVRTHGLQQGISTLVRP